MTPSPSNLNNSQPYNVNDQVAFGNGQNLPISHTGQSFLLNKIQLFYVLVVSHLTKNLLSIRKLTNDQPLDVLFSNSIQHRLTKAILA